MNSKKLVMAGLMEAASSQGALAKNSVSVVCADCGEETKRVKRRFQPARLTPMNSVNYKGQAVKVKTLSKSGFRRLCPHCAK